MLIILFLQSLIIWSPWTSWLLNFSGNYFFDRFIFYLYLRLKNHIIIYHESSKFNQIFQIGLYLLHNIVLVSAVQLSESATSIHTSSSSWIPLPHPIHLGHHRAPSWGSCAVLHMEKAVATHSSVLAWKIPGTEEPGRLQSVGSLRVGHDWATSLSLFTFMHWRRKWQPSPVFLPEESQGRGSLVGFRLWGHAESDMTEVT